MPLVAEPNERKERRGLWWAVVFSVLCLLAAGLVVWSIFQTVSIPVGQSQLEMAYLPPTIIPPVIVMYDSSTDEYTPLYKVEWGWSADLPWGGLWRIAMFSPSKVQFSPNIRSRHQSDRVGAYR
jgi:hypothetical protein